MTNPELETLKAIERQLKDCFEDFQESNHPNSFIHGLEPVLTIIKERKATIEKKEFNDPNYYQKQSINGSGI